jgi:hypothetical protein
MLSIYSNATMRANMLKTLSVVTARDFSKKHKKNKASHDEHTDQETFEDNHHSHA